MEDGRAINAEAHSAAHSLSSTPTPTATPTEAAIAERVYFRSRRGCVVAQSPSLVLSLGDSTYALD